MEKSDRAGAPLRIDITGAVAVVRLSRPAKRNALDEATVQRMEAFFTDPPAELRAAVLEAEGDHFCAGLDLSDLVERDTFDSVQYSRLWHRAFERIEHGRLPVVAALHGAVIGGGLELAAAAHIRVAEPSTFYAMPEAQRGLFVGGGGSVRLPRLIGAHRLTDMMLTGRVLDAEEGHAAGISHYLVPAGDGPKMALELAEKIATNSPVTNFAVLQALPRIVESDPDQGYLLEALMSAVASTSDESRALVAQFLAGRSAKVRPWR